MALHSFNDTFLHFSKLYLLSNIIIMLHKNLEHWDYFIKKHDIIPLGNNEDILKIINFLEASIYLELTTFLASLYPKTSFEKFAFAFEMHIKNKAPFPYPRIQHYNTYDKFISFLMHWHFSKQEEYIINFNSLHHFRSYLEVNKFTEHLINYNDSHKLFPKKWVADISLFLKNTPVMIQKIIDHQPKDFFSICCSEKVSKKITPLLIGTFIECHVFKPEDNTIHIQSDYSKLVFVSNISKPNELKILEKLITSTQKELGCILISPYNLEGGKNMVKDFSGLLDARQIKYKLINSIASNQTNQETLELQNQELIQLIKQV